MSGGRVVVVGSVNVDLVIRGERLPSPGETVIRRGLRASPRRQGRQPGGGRGPARTAGPVRRGGRRRRLRRRGAGGARRGGRRRDSFLTTLEGTATGVALILVDRQGENLISVAPGANAALEPSAVQPAFDRIGIHAGDVVLVCHELPTATVREALRAGRDLGARTVFNPAPADGIDRTVLAAADVISPNRGELLTLAATDARRSGRAALPRTPALDVAKAARSLLDASADGPGVREAVVVTIGPAGALLVTHEATEDVPSIAVDAVDTTGAGDAFNGALAAAIAEDRSLARGRSPGRGRWRAGHDEGRGARGHADRRRARRALRRSTGSLRR